jgi:hypothetical protein
MFLYGLRGDNQTSRVVEVVCFFFVLDSLAFLPLPLLHTRHLLYVKRVKRTKTRFLLHFLASRLLCYQISSKLEPLVYTLVQRF